MQTGARYFLSTKKKKNYSAGLLKEWEAARSGFVFIEEDRYENEVSFTSEELVAYLTTQTNVVAAVEVGRESFESANQWLLEQVRPFFAKASATFVFVTRAWYLRKEAVR